MSAYRSARHGETSGLGLQALAQGQEVSKPRAGWGQHALLFYLSGYSWAAKDPVPREGARPPFPRPVGKTVAQEWRQDLHRGAQCHRRGGSSTALGPKGRGEGLPHTKGGATLRVVAVCRLRREKKRGERGK